MNEDPHKERFMAWLDRFAWAGLLKKTFRQFKFSEEEMLRLKPQIEARYKLKARFTKSRGAD